MNLTKTHKQRVLEHLQKYGRITTWEAFSNYGITRLSEYIRQLRLEDYDIETIWARAKNRYGDSVHYGIFKLKEDKNNE